MGNNTIFSQLHKAFSNSGEVSTLPEGLEISGGEVFFQGYTACLQVCNVPVRDSGPDAWGYQVKLCLPALYSWDHGRNWYYEEDSLYKYLTCVGSELDLIYVNKEDNLEYLRYIAVEW